MCLGFLKNSFSDELFRHYIYPKIVLVMKLFVTKYAMSGQFRRNGKIWVRVLADLPITRKPTEVRMGRGKGNPTGWIARVSVG